MPQRVGSSSGGVALIGGRYELVCELRTVGDVVDWEAFDSALERRVVVQFLRQELVEDPAAVERFWQDARSAARASAASGERILDGGIDAETGRVFIVREWAPRPAGLDDATRRLDATRKLHVAARVAPVSGWWHTHARQVALVGLIVVAGVSLFALRPGVEGWLAWVNEPLGQASRSFLLAPVVRPPTVGDQAVQTAPTPAGTLKTATPVAPPKPTAPAAPTIAPTPRATPTPELGSGVARRIVNTDGRGVALRAAPGGDRLPGRGYDEGVTVTAFERSGEWTRIRGSDGREGWVLSVTLAP
jgi:SH3-like domain-containing protein